MRFSFPPTNFKGTKCKKEYKKQSLSPVLKLWHSASTMIFQPQRSGWVSQTFSPSSCYPIISARTVFISRHFTSWYEQEGGESGITEKHRATLALWVSKVSMLRTRIIVWAKDGIEEGTDTGKMCVSHSCCTSSLHILPPLKTLRANSFCIFKYNWELYLCYFISLP